MKSSHKNIIQSRQSNYYSGFSDVRNTKNVTKKEYDSIGNLKRVYGWGKSTFCWYTKPIYGFLKKNVGRKFDDVKSELYSRYTKAFERYILNDILHSLFLGFCDEFYLDDNNLLQYKQFVRKQYKKQKFDKIKLIQGKNYYKHDGIWYEVQVKEAKRDVCFADVFYSEYSFHSSVYGSKGTYSYNKVIVGKRQLNKREIKKLCLQ